jgi:putative aldouronate transport system permease protein
VTLGTTQSELAKYVRKNNALYIMLIPGIVFFLLFKYLPMAGLVIGFQDYNAYKGFLASEWVGLKWFVRFFSQRQFTRVLWNTLIINIYQLVFAFPAPIILACLLNEVRAMRFKRTVQTIAYLPHFLSWSIIYGLAFMLLSQESGLINQAIVALGREPVAFLQKPGYFRPIIIGAQIWRDMGWGTIIFLAALAGISPALYESATIDGAGRWKQFQYITFPGLLPAIMILMLLNIGRIMDLGFEQIWVFLNPLTYETGEVLETYIYRWGVQQGNYSFTTAVGLFKSLIGLIMIVIANRTSRSITGESLY